MAKFSQIVERAVGNLSSASPLNYLSNSSIQTLRILLNTQAYIPLGLGLRFRLYKDSYIGMFVRNLIINTNYLSNDDQPYTTRHYGWETSILNVYTCITYPNFRRQFQVLITQSCANIYKLLDKTWIIALT